VYYYSTQAFLAWCFNHYFYQRHWAFVATPFYPYGASNPPSSNPYRIYGNLYEEWFHRDHYGKYVQALRAGLHLGVLENEALLTLDHATRLKRITDKVSVLLLYPIVYRVELERIERGRLEQANSALEGSLEYLIPDLLDDEFDVLFLDETALDSDLRQLAKGHMSRNEALRVMESRC
jgi:hypothetical protein